MTKTRNMRDLNPEDIDQLITISGMVIRNSQIIPEMREGGCGQIGSTVNHKISARYKFIENG